MSVPANKKLAAISFSDITGGVNLNDPASSLPENQCSDLLNVLITERGFKRWPGSSNLTAQGACTDYLRGLFPHQEVDGTQHLLTVFGGKLYSVNKSTGAVTELYDMGGNGEAWGGSHFGTFFVANGSAVVKYDGSNAYRVGIAAPTGVSAAAATSGGSLEDGVYTLYACYARKISGLNVLYSKGQSLGTVTITGGSGSGKITISDFANSSDSQVNNKIIFMSDANGSTYYQYHQTNNNTTTSFDITSDTNKSNSITYGAFASTNDLPENFSFLFAFANRLWGVVNNKLYYSMKASANSTYNLERFPAINYIEYPYRITGIFSIGKHLCLNTQDNGIIIQPDADINVNYEHIEQRESFVFMRTVSDWRGGKIGLTKDKLGFFSGETFKFEPWDYGYNIRPVLNKAWSESTANFYPCGITYRRSERIEYHLSLRDTTLTNLNNNRTYVLNLSRTMFGDVDNFKTPWEPVDRGFNYACVDSDNTLFMGQSHVLGSTIYKELSTATTQIGLYNSDGEYITTATDMPLIMQSRRVINSLFTKAIIEEIRGLFYINTACNLSIDIIDFPNNSFNYDVNMDDFGRSLWGTMVWGDNWSIEEEQMFQQKADMGAMGYVWLLKLTQTANDPNFKVNELNVLVTNESGRGI